MQIQHYSGKIKIKMTLDELNEQILFQSTVFKKVKDELKKRIIGQETFIEKLLLAIITGGHLLIEGVPVLQKQKPLRV